MNQAAGRLVLFSVIVAAILGAVVILTIPDYRPSASYSAWPPRVSMPPAVAASNRGYMPGVRVDGDGRP